MNTLQVAEPSAPAYRPVVPALHTVIILNMFYSGLGIARALFGKGVRVVGLSADDKIYGNFTRLCEVRRAPSSQDQPESLAEFLLNRCGDLEGSVIFPTRDADVMFLDRYRSELETKYTICIPSLSSLRRTIDKYELVTLAGAAGVAVPRTLRLDSAADLLQVSNKVGFPCVLKPVCAYQWRSGGAWQRVGARKAVRVDDPETLQAEYETLSTISSPILAQEWIDGSTDQIVILGGYAAEGGELLASFTARKILQTPDDCGTGCIVRSEPMPQLLAPTQRLLKLLRYRGMAEVEYKYDSMSQTYKLIEINTRHWDQHELGLASGINLTWVAYCDLTHQPIPPGRTTLTASWVAEDALLMRLLRSVFRPELRAHNVWSKISSRRIYAIFARRDPIPFARYFLGTMLPQVVSLFLKKVKIGIWRRQS